MLENEALFKVFSTNLGIDKYLILLDKNASTAISLAALRTVGALFLFLTLHMQVLNMEIFSDQVQKSKFFYFSQFKFFY